MSTSADQQQFARLLEAEVGGLDALHALLVREHALLTGAGAPEALEELARQKQAASEALERLALATNQFLRQIGLDADRSGLGAFATRLPNRHPVRRHWQRLLELADACRDQNEINGAIVELSRRQVSNALQVLKRDPEAAATYGAEGGTRDGGPSRSLGRA